MTANMQAFQLLLNRMRAEFLSEIPERCDRIDALVMALDKDPADREAFNALYREVHSLKGSGGTHGLPIITTLCHQLENLLTEADVQRNFDATFTVRAQAHVNLLEQVEAAAQAEQPDFSAIEAAAQKLRLAVLQRRKAVLIAETSAALAGLYRQTLAGESIQLTLVNDGLVALERLLHEPFDLVIVGRELKTLNGIALMAAVRATGGSNRHVPAILLSSGAGAVPAHVGFSAIVGRDARQMPNLVQVANKALESRQHQ